MNKGLTDGLEPRLPVAQSMCNLAVRRWLGSESARLWQSYTGGMHTKCFFRGPSEGWAKSLLALDRHRIRRIVGAITGHCRSNEHLTRMGILDDPECTCGLGNETGLHVICECPKFQTLRRRLLGGYTVEPGVVQSVGPALLDRFLAGTMRFE